MEPTAPSAPHLASGPLHVCRPPSLHIHAPSVPCRQPQEGWGGEPGEEVRVGSGSECQAPSTGVSAGVCGSGSASSLVSIAPWSCGGRWTGGGPE